MEEEDEGGFDGVGDEVTIPELLGCVSPHEPEDRNDGQRERQRDEQSHLVVAIELVNNHQGVDIAERNEAEGEDAQSMHTLCYQFLFVRTKQPRHLFREKPDSHTGDEHRNGDEAERLT